MLGKFELGELIMRKTMLAALCATSVIYAGSFETWNGAKVSEDANSDPQIHTGLGNGLKTEGYWYSYNDASGLSKISWSVPIDPLYDKQSLEPVIYECKGFCGTAILNKESNERDPFVGVGFNVVGQISETDQNPATGDASAWGGLCVTYTSDTDIALELGLGDDVDSTINYANPAVNLPASKTGNKVVASWSDFKQPSWYDGTVKFDGETAAKQLAAVHFKIQAVPGDYKFNICAVGPKDGTCPEKCGTPTATEAIQVARRASATKAILNGRTLEFTGIKATAEVINSLGQVVMKGAIGNAATLNLATLDAGIYIIRISGNNVNLSRKVVLK